MLVDIVSGSAIVVGALKPLLRPVAEDVRTYVRIEDVPAMSSTSIMIYEIGSAVNDVERLLKHVSQAELSSVIVLSRDGQDLHELAPLIGKVGAIVPSSAEPEDVVLIAQMMHKGMTLLPSSVVMSMGATSIENRRATDERLSVLTSQETKVLQHLARGETNKTIARHLGVGDGTVGVHVRSVLKKIGARNRTEAALLVAERTTSFSLRS